VADHRAGPNTSCPAITGT